MTSQNLHTRLTGEYEPSCPEELELMQYWSKQALAIQDACSLVGVTNTYMTLVNELFPLSRRKGRGTDWVNHHPIVVVFVDKLRDLSTNHDEMGRVFASFDWVMKMNEGVQTT